MCTCVCVFDSSVRVSNILRGRTGAPCPFQFPLLGSFSCLTSWAYSNLCTMISFCYVSLCCITVPSLIQSFDHEDFLHHLSPLEGRVSQLVYWWFHSLFLLWQREPFRHCPWLGLQSQPHAWTLIMDQDNVFDHNLLATCTSGTIKFS